MSSAVEQAGVSKDFDAEALLRFDIPEAKQRYSRKDAAFYALSIGIGRNPLEARQLAFTDHRRADFMAFPTAVLILAYPGFWLGDEKTQAVTGVDPRRILHISQEIEWHESLPPEGDVVGQSRIIDLIDKGCGRGSILLSEREIVEVVSGRKLATLRQGHYLRGHGGIGSGPEKPREPAPATASSPCDSLVAIRTYPEQALLYRMNGDENPLHCDPAVARSAGYPRPILHGLCTLGLVCHALLETLLDYQSARLRKVRFQMTAPVFPGETLQVEMWRNGAFCARVAERENLIVGKGEICI
jgi:acyl dehydratase